jgi:hypothetical protein
MQAVSQEIEQDLTAPEQHRNTSEELSDYGWNSSSLRLEVEGHNLFGHFLGSFESELSGCINSGLRQDRMPTEHFGGNHFTIRPDFDRDSHRSAEPQRLGHFRIMWRHCLHCLAVGVRLLRQ